MRYTVPDYYKDFSCIASACPATCCAGWQIVIDEKSLKNYKNLKGPFGSRLLNSINQDEMTFDQFNGRCAFLDENNLCDIYTEAGPDYLCRTCRRYPRHIEEFDNERECSLSVSCPVVAKILLQMEKPPLYLTKEDDRSEAEDDNFDFFLYSALQDTRAVMFEILRDSSRNVKERLAAILAIGHDVQNRIDSNQVFDIQNVIEKYKNDQQGQKLHIRFQKFLQENPEKPCSDPELLSLLDELEVLDPTWPSLLKEYRGYLEKGAYGNEKLPTYKNEPALLILTEYFIYTYFCGAVYDGDALAKVKMSLYSVLVIFTLAKAAMFCMDTFTLQDFGQIIWKYSRELEHSDPNLNKLEELMNESKQASFENLLMLILQL